MLMKLSRNRIDTPLGVLIAVQSDDGLCDLDFSDRWKAKLTRLKKRFGTVEFEEGADPHGIAAALSAYFAGDLRSLDGVRVDAGGTAFERAVWSALRQIPVGATLSYGELAGRLGNPSASRAVGSANGRNPVAIVGPCHRVIRRDGTLGGYAGGLARKKHLLAHEGVAGAWCE
jgi:methylated-DNA-[protein]-cysteine S-methyltransferase